MPKLSKIPPGSPCGRGRGIVSETETGHDGRNPLSRDTDGVPGRWTDENRAETGRNGTAGKRAEAGKDCGTAEITRTADKTR